MQHEIVDAHDLLLPDGSLVESGWARKPLLRYNREQICYPPKRFKEWHYFFCGDETFGIGFSIANIGPLHNFSLSFVDFKNKVQANNSSIRAAKDSVMVMPEDAYGSLRFKGDTAECQVTGGREKILFRAEWQNFRDKDPLSVDFTLYMPAGDTLYHCFPFTEKKGQFFYAHKMDDIRLGGTFSLGDLRYTFDPKKAFAVQDWGRGVWPSATHAYWGGGNGSAEGKPFSFNIGYDYQLSDTSAATENALVYDGKIHKLEEVVFHVDESQTEWLKPWTFTSSDGRFEMRMDPVLDRHTEGPLGPSHQVFGYYSGMVTLDGGRKLSIDKLFGFAEKNVYRWALVENSVAPLFSVANFFGRIFKKPKG
ncbi:MAG: DUF2804 domain-containing protein [Treponema sp.]|jgi:hypothetical protein|nr:DUF2804 domain-containing protein [Treponema sp.]